MSHEWMAPAMFIALIVFLLTGLPVAFSLAALGLASGMIAIEFGFFPAQFMANLPYRVFGILSNELLLSIPFFTLMGAILERSGLAANMLHGFARLCGGLPGGLAYAVILVGAILGAITGTVAASVIAIGVIALPIMLRHGYSPQLATGVVAASGTITQVIPPSLVLIVLADQLGKSVGDMYLGAIGPSIAQVLIFLGFVLAMSIIRPQSMPPLPKEERQSHGWTLWKDIVFAIVPSLVLIFMVLGTIFMGLATPTEAGAMGVVGALVLAFMHGGFNLHMLWEGMVSTMRITVMVIFILIGATVFTLVFQGVDGGKWIEHLFMAVGADDPVSFLIVVNLLIFGLAFFLDFFEIAFIVIPLLAPIAKDMGIDLIWLGILICVNMQTSFMHPPFGFALFYLRGIAPPSIKSSDIYLGAIPWLGLQLLLVGILIFYPELVTGLLDKPITQDVQGIEIKLDETESSQPAKPAPSEDPADYFKRK
ncbi:MAG: TRAP transporter large permease subunit [Burkholderiaceae bacterium]|nr:TRAP transporter large permease subunit [Burkholderiaceae bacterium]